MIEHQIDRRNLKPHAAEVQHQTVFLGHAVEAPAIVRRLAVEVAHFLHPLPTPRRGIEQRHHPERPRDGPAKPLAHGLSGDQLGHRRVVGVEHELAGPQQRQLEAVGHPPIDEKRPLVLQTGGQREIGRAQVGGFVPAEPQLGLPAGEVGINRHGSIRRDQSGPAADHQHQPGTRPHLMAQLSDPIGIEKPRQFEVAKKTEHRIVAAEKRLQHPVDFRRGKQGLGSADGGGRLQSVREFRRDLCFIHAGIAFHGDHRSFR